MNLVSVFRLALLVSAVLSVQANAQTLQLPPIDRIVNYQPKLPLQVFTADGVELAQFGAERRDYLPLSRTPKLMQQALLSVEDSRFREHSGIDFQGMARAALAPILGRRMHGASTVTQQLVRTMLLTRDFSVERKTKEIMLALKVEQALSKDRILEIYFNEIYLGQRAYGFSAAAQTYFGKPLDKLTVAEFAMLAGLPQNPHYANPVVNFARAKKRQEHVLERMLATQAITEPQYRQAVAQTLVIRPPGQRTVQADHVAEMARRAVVERFGVDGAYSTGMKVYTSLRAAEQRAAHEAVQRGVLAYDRRTPWRGPENLEPLAANLGGAELEKAAAKALKDHKDDEMLRVAVVIDASSKQVQAQLATGERVAVQGEGLKWASAGLAAKATAPLKIQRGSILRLQASGATQPAWSIVQWPDAEAALVALDSRTGRVRAMVGGFDFSTLQFNHATQGFRQPGSAYKPMLYSAALEERVMPATQVDDLAFFGANGWSPSNSYSNPDFLGPITLREALAKSSNMVSIRLMQHVSPNRARDWAARFGIEAAKQPDNLTQALGTGSASPLQMARAYATFANGGWRVTPVLVERIVDAQGKTLFEAPPPEPQTDDTRAIPERNAWVMNSLLNDVTRVGTAARAQSVLKRNDLYGKTGTTDGAVDAWFAGYQPSITAVVWMGHSKPQSLGDRESGGRLALPIWLDYMAVALKGVPIAPLAEPPPGLLKMGNDWLYSEWQNGNWVGRIAAEGGAQMVPQAAPPVTPAVQTAPVPEAAASSPLPVN